MVDGVVVPALISVALAKEIVIMILSAPGIWYVALTIVVLTFQRNQGKSRIVAPKPPKVTKTIILPKTCLANHNTAYSNDQTVILKFLKSWPSCFHLL